MTEDKNNCSAQITVVNIKYGNVMNSKIKHRPEMAVLDVPANILNIKGKEKFEDAIETFSYNTITKRYGAEVSFCQTFLN